MDTILLPPCVGGSPSHLTKRWGREIREAITDESHLPARRRYTDIVLKELLMRTLSSLLLGVAVAYGALVVFVYFYQARLLYLPEAGGRTVTATPAAMGLAYQDLWITVEDGPVLHGWFVPAGQGGAPVLLFLHGNAGNISHRLDSIRIFHDLGLHVLIFDYRGYGQSSGRPTEEGTYRDARAVWSYLTAEAGYPPACIALFGRSLGAAVASHLARHVRPGALILESPFVSVPELARLHYGYLPVRWLSRFRYATAEHVAHAQAPVLVVHSPDDEIVPIDHGMRVYRRAPEPKSFLRIRGGHNDGFLVSGKDYVEGLSAFIESSLPVCSNMR